MADKKVNNSLIIITILLTVFVLPKVVGYIKSANEPSIEDVRTKIADYLYEKYGEEFVVDRIGSRDDDGVTEYVARIYPKSIIGTNKAGDKYYYGSASVDKLAFGKLDEPGDSYGLIQINIGAEKYLLPKAKELFGEKVLLKTEVKYKKKEKNGFYAWYKEPNFLKAIKELKKQPEERRIELELYVYVFDRIEDKAEKEKRRQDIFNFAQYLKQEGLFEYLELGVIFIDERVLASRYNSYKWKVEDSPKVEEKIEGETVYLPPLELRKEMSEKLQREIDKMSEEELLANMREIRKSDLSYDDLVKYNGNYGCFIKSPRLLEEYYKSYLSRGGGKNITKS